VKAREACGAGKAAYHIFFKKQTSSSCPVGCHDVSKEDEKNENRPG
jgi:hypothetical protein